MKVMSYVRDMDFQETLGDIYDDAFLIHTHFLLESRCMSFNHHVMIHVHIHLEDSP